MIRDKKYPLLVKPDMSSGIYQSVLQEETGYHAFVGGYMNRRIYGQPNQNSNKINLHLLKYMISMSRSFVSALCLVFAIIFLGTHPIYAQGSGNISGTVVDKVSGETLPGANVFLEGTSLGSSTNGEGEYILHQIPAGDYELITKYIGYKEQTISITVIAGKTIEVNVELDYAAFEVEDVVVTAQARGQMGAINQQLASNTIKNVVSSDRIQDVPDVNAAESVSRLPGLSLIRSGRRGTESCNPWFIAKI
jgi:hypothetical protein